MTPYFDRDGITIYHARCEDVLPDIDPATVDLLLTDPPYGINLDTDNRGLTRGGRSHAPVAGDSQRFDPSGLLLFGTCVLFGANLYAHSLPERGSWLVWDRDIVSGFAHRSQAELAWTNAFNGGVRLCRVPWDGNHRVRLEPATAFVHPTQKPVALMRWIIDRWTKPGDLVFDPYMGSGPVAQACHELGRRYIGIELVEDYCAVAVTRLRQGTLDFGGAA